MDASDLGLEAAALQVLAFVLTYLIHSTLLLGLACLLAARAGRSLAVRERIWKTAVFGALLTAVLQVASSHHTPLVHWTLRGGAHEEGPLAAQVEPAPSAPQHATPHAQDALDVRAPSAARTPLRRPSAAAFGAAGDAPASIRTAQLPAPSLDVASAPRESERAGVGAWIAANWRAWSARGLALWLTFAALVVALFGVMCARLARRMRGRVELDHGPLREMLDELTPLAFPRGRRVRLFVAPELRAPLSMGFASAAICVPPRALTELGRDEQETMLAHELAHLMRRDPLWLSLIWIVERVFFFQPLLRVARAELCDLAELACDDWAARRTGNGLALASCLARIAEWIVGAPRSLPATSMAELHGRCRLTQRIERLLDEDERPADERGGRWLAPMASAGLAALVLVAPGVSASLAPPDLVSDVATASVSASGAVEAPDVDAASSAPHAVAITSSAPPVVATLEPRTAPLLDPAIAPPGESLRAEFDALGASLALLRDELGPLRELSQSFDDTRQLDALLDALEQRIERLERRRAALENLLQVLEAFPTKPAHPSSTPSASRIARSLER